MPETDEGLGRLQQIPAVEAQIEGEEERRCGKDEQQDKRRRDERPSRTRLAKLHRAACRPGVAGEDQRARGEKAVQAGEPKENRLARVFERRRQQDHPSVACQVDAPVGVPAGADPQPPRRRSQPGERRCGKVSAGSHDRVGFQDDDAGAGQPREIGGRHRGEPSRSRRECSSGRGQLPAG